jgi:hypothetical protein
VYEALLPYGWSDRWLALLHSLERDDVAPGRVLRHDGMLVNVVGPDGAVAPYAVHTNVEPQPVVGDWVATTDAVVAVPPDRACCAGRTPTAASSPSSPTSTPSSSSAGSTAR